MPSSAAASPPLIQPQSVIIPATTIVPSSVIPPGQLVELNDPLIHSYADRKARPVSLAAMLAMGEKPAYLLTAAQWLWHELPVRLAKRLRDLEDLPFGLSKSVEVQSLMALYRASLAESLSIKCPTTRAEELEFTQLIKDILTRHQQIVVDLASGVNGGFLLPLSRLQRPPSPSPSGVNGSGVNGNGNGSANIAGWRRPLHQHFILQEFLDRFNAARIGLRTLMAQHVALHTTTAAPVPTDPHAPRMVGVIEVNCDPSKIIRQSILDAERACMTKYGYTIVPKVELQDMSLKSGGIKNFSYVSAHIRFMAFELLKNAMKATIEHARKKKAMAAGWKPSATDDASAEPNPMPSVELTPADLPPIQVVVVDGPTDVTVKISDRGGGIKRSELPMVFNYTYSATQKSLSAAQQAAQVKKAEQMHQAAVAAAAAAAAAAAQQQLGNGAAGPKLTNASVAPTPASTAKSLSILPPAVTPGTGTSDWLTGANHAPTLNPELHDFVEAFGLPITRLYARYFGGDLQLFSLHGHGTDAYLYINRNADFEEMIQD